MLYSLAESTSSTREGIGNHLLLLLLDSQHLVLDCIFSDELIHCDVAGLCDGNGLADYQITNLDALTTNTIHSVNSLLFNSRLPPGIQLL